MDKQREEFEDWFACNTSYEHKYIRGERMDEKGVYHSEYAYIAWQAWQQAQKVAVPEWINVNLLSPQIDTQVLICVDDDVTIAFYRDFDGEGYFEGYCSCKYWMPLPKAMIKAQEQNDE